MKTKYFKASIILPAAGLIVGLVLQAVLGNFPLESMRFPVNMIIFAELFVMTILLHVFFKNKNFVKFLSSGYAAISSISLFALLVILMVLIPQDKSGNGIIKVLGLDRIIFTWTYAISTLYMLLSLGLVTMRRLFPLNLRNIFFYINHFGLWLVLATASLGQADKQKITITVPEGELIWYGYDENGNYTEPDIAIKLESFNIKFYPPKLAVIDDAGELKDPKDFQPTELISGENIKYGSFKISVIEVFEDAIAVNDSVKFVTGLPEKTIVAKLKVNNDTVLIQNSTSFHPPVTARIAEDKQLVILNPEPKYFGSEISLFTRTGIKDEKHTIEVNKPLVLNSWTVYQTSYFKTPEYEGYVSVFTAVFDPWLKIVYVGFAMMFIGAIYLIFSRRTKNISNE